MTVPASISVNLHTPAELQISSPLAKALIASPGGKGRGLARVRRKARRWLFYFVHRQLGIPARGTMTVVNGTSFEVNCANTGVLDFASRTSHQSAIEPEVTGLLLYLAPRLMWFTTSVQTGATIRCCWARKRASLARSRPSRSNRRRHAIFVTSSRLRASEIW